MTRITIFTKVTNATITETPPTINRYYAVEPAIIQHFTNARLCSRLGRRAEIPRHKPGNSNPDDVHFRIWHLMSNAYVALHYFLKGVLFVLFVTQNQRQQYFSRSSDCLFVVDETPVIPMQLVTSLVRKPFACVCTRHMSPQQ